MKLKNNKKHSNKLMIIFSITMFFIGIYISFNYLEKNTKINTSDKYNNFLLDYEFSNKTIKERFTSLLEKEKVKKEYKPLIYIYNTHDTEEYASNNLFNFNPNVTMVNYILKEQFEDSNYSTLVEERSIKDILSVNNWNYSYSYKASRMYLEDVKSTYKSINYYIDVHRDSLPRNRTTVTINDKDYASILFLIGLENDNYEENLAFTNKINDKLNELYPNLSKGILEKSGPGVNGIYNQDFSSKAILIEVGGYENNTYEVLNTALAFSKCYLEVLNEE